MSRKLVSGFVVMLLGASVSFAQVVPGFVVQEYATVEGPIGMTFNMGNGDLFVGHDLSLSGGGSGDPTRIHRVGFGGFPVGLYGDTDIGDPDAVLFDAAGGVSGTPGSVLVAGDQGLGVGGQIFAIAPDQTTTAVIPPHATMGNPNAMRFDSTGRVVIADDGSTGEVYMLDSGVVSLLYTLPVRNGALALDLATDNLYTAGVDGTIRIHDINGNLVDGAFVTGLTTGRSSPLAFGLGGGYWGNDLYSIDTGTGELLRIDGFGTPTVIGSGFGDVDRIATDITFGPDGAMYVAFFDENRVIRIIPEPSTLLLLGLGGLALLRRRN